MLTVIFKYHSLPHITHICEALPLTKSDVRSQ